MFDGPETLDWDELYQDRPLDEMRFYQTALDHDLAAESQQHGIASGPLLDLGSGPSKQAMALARMGFDVTMTSNLDTIAGHQTLGCLSTVPLRLAATYR